MLAYAAAAVLGLALLLDLLDAHAGDMLTNATLVTLALLLMALHLAGAGTTWHHRHRS